MVGPVEVQARPPPPGSTLGLYVHVPFCAATCDFCAFYQTKPSAEKIRRYLDTVRAEAALVSRAQPLDTVFWGGGTPGLLPPDDLRHLGETVLTWAGGVAPREWTVELAPASVTLPRLRALRELGVTRVSMGVQSFQPDWLDALGRIHTREQILRAYERIRDVGFPSVNLDLMFALPGQTETEWTADLETALGLAPDHLSTYCLTFEEDTALWVKLSQGRVKLDPDHEARLYLHTWDVLEAAGYPQYEVSNFARPGHACHHNLNTWHMHEWVGLGPAAASQHAGVRGGNPADLDAWSAHVAAGRRVTEDRTVLSPALLLEDALIFGLRLTAGVDLAVLRQRFPQGPWSQVEAVAEELVAGELAERVLPADAADHATGSRGPAGAPRPDRLRLTRRGRLLADAVGARVMESLAEVPAPASAHA